MTEIQLKALKSLDEIKENNGSKEISVPTRCKPNGSLILDTLIFRDNGALVFTGNFDLKVKNVYNYKDGVPLCDQEFIIAGNDGSDAEAAGNLNFDLGKINGDVHIQTSAGRGGAPDVNIIYTLISRGNHIYVNGEAAKKKCCISFKSGDCGMDGAVKIRRRSIEEIMDNLRGMYILDLSDEEEREFCLNKLGGLKLLNKYEAVNEAINKSSLKSNDGKKPSIKIALQESRSSYLTDSELTEASVGISSDYGSNTKFGTFSQTFSIDLYDANNLISDNKTASKWKFIVINAEAVNTSCAAGSPVIRYDEYIKTDTYGGVVEFCSDKLAANLMEGNIVTKIKVTGIDGNGELVCAAYGAEVNNASYKMGYMVQDIEVKDPKWNRKCDDGIIMLYGRTNERAIYSKADYSGGDYCSKAIKSGNKVATLMPLSGTVTFSSDYKPVGLTPPGGNDKFWRPTLDYSNKAADRTDPDITYYKNLNDKELYDLLKDKNCFKAVQSDAGPHVDFDFSLDRGDKTSRLDWHDDIFGEKNNHERVVFLRGNFCYRILKKGYPEDRADDIPIGIISVSKENLKELNRNKKKNEERKYYEFLKGSHIIFIPPIHIYWGCLGKSVLLKTADGTLKTAESVKIGDRLLSHGGKTVTVDNVFKGHDETIYRLSCDGFETLMSGAHPVLGENGKGTTVRNLKAGDKIMTENGGMTEVLSVKEESYNDTVYNFTFEGENESVYVIADGIFAGDLNAQNEAPEEPRETEEEKKKRLKLIEEMHSLCREIRSADRENKK